jgi:hypothetical protein
VIDVGVVRRVQERVGDEAFDDLARHLEIGPEPPLAGLSLDRHLLGLQSGVLLREVDQDIRQLAMERRMAS